tara:strand:- start:18844 stop:19635 length:792 start_codon:yes stop_codon:yes gene_type:complete
MKTPKDNENEILALAREKVAQQAFVGALNTLEQLSDFDDGFAYTPAYDSIKGIVNLICGRIYDRGTGLHLEEESKLVDVASKEAFVRFGRWNHRYPAVLDLLDNVSTSPETQARMVRLRLGSRGHYNTFETYAIEHNQNALDIVAQKIFDTQIPGEEMIRYYELFQQHGFDNFMKRTLDVYADLFDKKQDDVQGFADYINEDEVYWPMTRQIDAIQYGQVGDSSKYHGSRTLNLLAQEFPGHEKFLDKVHKELIRRSRERMRY